MTEMQFSLILPAFNEAKRLPKTLASARSYLSETFSAYEILVVDDGSEDDTVAVARDILAHDSNSRVIPLGTNQGKGAAVRAGALEAKGQYVLFSDSDLSTPIADEARLRAAIDAGADLAIGSRRHPESEITLAQNVVRQSMGRIFNLFVRMAGLSGFEDTQCGFKMFTHASAERIFRELKTDGFAFDVEILLLARNAGLSLAEIPVQWENDPESRVHMIRDSLRMLWELVLIRLNHLRH